MATRSVRFDLLTPSAATLRSGLRVLAIVLLTITAANIRVPLPGTPVPMTLQTVVVLFSGMALGSRLGSISQVLYLLLGGVGLPVFAGSQAGPAYLFGATGGYLLAFPLAAWCVGRLVAHRPGFWTQVLAAASGTALIFSCGVGWLAVITGDLNQALVLGIIPFVPAALLKCLLAAALGMAAAPAPRQRLSATGESSSNWPTK